MKRKMIFVGGPLDGTEDALAPTTDIVHFGGDDEHDYIRAQRRSAPGRLRYEWHDRGWKLPAVRAIKEAVLGRLDRLR